MFSLTVLSVMVAIALDMVLAVTVAVAGSFWVGKFLSSNTEGINSMALQQGGLGLVLTTLIIMAPPMAAGFFQGMLEQFTAYSAFGGIGRNTGADSAGRTPGTPGYSPSHVPTQTGQPSTRKQPGNFNDPTVRNVYSNSSSSQQDVVRTNSSSARGS